MSVISIVRLLRMRTNTCETTEKRVKGVIFSAVSGVCEQKMGWKVEVEGGKYSILFPFIVVWSRPALFSLCACFVISQ